MQEKFFLHNSQEKENQAILHSLNIQIPDDWDPDIFISAFHDFNREFQEASPEKRREILMGRYFDSFFLKKGSKESDFKRDYMISPPAINGSRKVKYIDEIDFSRLSGAVFGGNTFEPLSKNPREPYCPNNLETAQYGPSKVFDVPSGMFIAMSELSEQDVVGTSFLSQCSILVAKDKNSVFLSHITVPQDIDQAYDFMRKKFKADARFSLVLPKLDPSPESKQTPGAWWDKIADKHKSDSTLVRYRHIGYQHNNPHGINSTTVLLTRDGLRTVGIRELKGNALHTPVEIVKEEIQDVEF